MPGALWGATRVPRNVSQVLVMSIYAILGVEFFMNYGETGSYTNELGEVVEITTARDLQYGALQ